MAVKAAGKAAGASTGNSDAAKQLAAAIAVLQASGDAGKQALRDAGLAEARSSEKGNVHAISYDKGRVTLEADLIEGGAGRWKIAGDKASDRNKGTKRRLFCDTYMVVEMPDGSEGVLVLTLTGPREKVA
jgi:hypothetical protein